MIAKAGQLWRTVRHLRSSQLYGRLNLYLPRPLPSMSAPPAVRARHGTWKQPAQRNDSLIGPTRFRFLNAEAELTKVGWDNPELARLWRYNLHYFDWMNAEGASTRTNWHRALVTTWIAENPPGHGTGWEPYPTSLRIVNWIKWALAGNTLGAVAIQSLAIQARWLMRRMEYHLLGNHLLANAKALVFAGLYFEGDEAQDWLESGLATLAGEIREQILPDGGHFELSPMYHALVLEDMLDLVNLDEAYNSNCIATRWRERIPLMLYWLQVMSHPDDEISFFNDSAIGIAPRNEELRAYSQRLNFSCAETLPQLTHLDNSGYVRMEAGEFTLLMDLARIGPDYIPGHSHADTLSFELSYAGQRVFVNSGTSEYGNGPERLRQRGTAAHNTVVVNGSNSSEVWSGFRVGRRAKPLAVSVGRNSRGTLYAQATHDGYRHLPGHPVVFRRVELNPASMIVTDAVSSHIKAEARFHLHPAVSITLTTSDRAIVKLADGHHLLLQSEGGSLRLEHSTWHPEFGVKISNQCLVLRFEGRSVNLNLTHEQ